MDKLRTALQQARDIMDVGTEEASSEAALVLIQAGFRVEYKPGYNNTVRCLIQHAATWMCWRESDTPGYALHETLYAMLEPVKP